MNIMCRYITPYKCKKCGGELTFFTTLKGTLIDYKRLLRLSKDKQDFLTKLRRYHIRSIKCLQCNKEYIIDWTNRGYPEEMVDKAKLQSFGIL